MTEFLCTPLSLHIWGKYVTCLALILASRDPDTDHHPHSLTQPLFPHHVGRNSHLFSVWQTRPKWEPRGEEAEQANHRGPFLPGIMPDAPRLQSSPRRTGKDHHPLSQRFKVRVTHLRSCSQAGLLVQGFTHCPTLLLVPGLLLSGGELGLGGPWALTPLFRSLKATSFSGCESQSNSICSKSKWTLWRKPKMLCELIM